MNQKAESIKSVLFKQEKLSDPQMGHILGGVEHDYIYRDTVGRGCDRVDDCSRNNDGSYPSSDVSNSYTGPVSN